jgi:hypothetical protein
MMIFFSERSSKNIFFSLRSRLVIMQLSELTTSSTKTNTSETMTLESIDWSKAFNTSLLSTVIDSKADSLGPESEIEAILKTPEYGVILLAAQNLAATLQISPEAATERLILTFRHIDRSWEKVLLQKGAQSLLGL